MQTVGWLSNKIQLSGIVAYDYGNSVLWMYCVSPSIVYVSIYKKPTPIVVAGASPGQWLV